MSTTSHHLSLESDDLQLLQEARETFQRLEQEIRKVIVGQEDIVRPIIAAVLSQGHTLVIGVPGLAKTLLIRTLADVLGWRFKRIQFTPDMMPADIIGMELLQADPASGTRSMQFVPGPLFANIILADEINRTPPKTQSALLESMQEYTVTSMGTVHRLERPFIVFATQNPIEQEGTYPLPEAQLDRFMFSLWMGYPTREEEEAIVMATTVDTSPQVETVCSLDRLRDYQHLVRRIPVPRHCVSYAVGLTRATRPDAPEASNYVKRNISWGAGPRASQHLILGAKALAVIEGQTSVRTEYIRQIAPLVLRHRLLPSYAAAGDSLDAGQIVNEIVKQYRDQEYAGS